MPPPTAEPFAARALLGPALRAQPDRRLVKLVRQGYETAFEEIVRRYRKPLDRFAAAIVGGRSEDVTQDAFSKALLALRGSENEIELRPWLYRIVRNTALNDLRDRPPSAEQLGETIPGGLSAAAEAERREEMAELIERLRALPEPQRAAIVMRELEGLSHEEIAAALGVGGGAARQAIHRARTTLRDGLGILVPLPLLRMLFDHGAEAAGGAAAAAGAGAAAGGGGAAALGGLGAGGALKVGAAAVLVAGTVGAGVAIQHDRGGGSAQAAPAASAGSGGGGSEASPGNPEGDDALADRDDHGSGRGSGDRGGSNNSGHGSGEDGSRSSSEGRGDDSGSGGSGHHGSGPGPSGRGSGPGEQEHGGGGHEDGGHGGSSGPGPSGSGGSGGDDGGHSGPGGDSVSNSGPSGGGDDLSEVNLLPPPPETSGSSGDGSGDSGSGSGSSGDGSASSGPG